MYSYTSGIENTQPIYQHSIGRCFTICQWATNFPTGTPGNTYLAFTFSGGKLFQQNQPWTTGQYYLVEWGGLAEPYLPPPTTAGGQVIVKNIVKNEAGASWNMANIVITVSDGTITYTPNIITRGTDTITIDLQPGYKRFSLKLDDGTTRGPFTNQYVHFQLPYIQTLYARAFAAGSPITITGGNFGVNTTGLSINAGGGLCVSPAIIEDYTTVICNLGASVAINGNTQSLLPIYITYDANNFVYTHRNNIPFYDFNTMTVIRACVDCQGVYGDVRAMISGAPVLDYNTPYQGTVVNSLQSDTIVKTYNLGSNKLCEGLDCSGTSSIPIKDLGGPLNNVVGFSSFTNCLPSVIYCNGASGFSTSTWYILFGQETGTGKLYNLLGQTSTVNEFAFYGGYQPTAPAATTALVDTAGGAITYTVGTTAGFKFSSRSFTFRGTTYSFPNIKLAAQNTLTLNIPEGTGTGYLVGVSIESKTFANTITVSYNKPTITSINPRITSIDAQVVINGNNFGPTIVGVVVTITLGATTKTVSCTMQTKHTALACTLPGGFGSQTVTVTVGGQSGTYTYAYQAPVITNVDQVGTTINVYGTTLGLTMAAVVCTPTLTSPSFTTNADPQIYSGSSDGTTRNGPVTLTISGTPTNAFQYNYKPIVDSTAGLKTGASSLITLSGKFLSVTRASNAAATVSVVIDGVTPCTTPANPTNGLKLTCTAPALTGSHTIEVTIDGKTSVSASLVAPAPTVVSYTQSLTTLVITGTNFGTSTSGVSILVGGISFNPTSVSDNTITATIPDTLRNGPLSVTVGGQPSTGTVNLAIAPAPISTTPVPTDGGPLVITGKYMNKYDYQSNQLTVTVTLGTNTPCTGASVTTDYTQVTCTAPPGIGINIPVTVTIGTQPSSNPMGYSYLAPSIIDIVQSHSLPEITITGANFGQSTSTIGISFSGVNNIPVSKFVAQYTSFVVPIPTTSRSDKVTVTVGTQTALQYLALRPIIASVGSPATQGSSITITGTFLQKVTYSGAATNVVVSVDNSLSCDLPTFPGTDGSALVCNAPAGTGPTHTAVVSIDNTASDSHAFTYQPPLINNIDQTDQVATFTGANFGSAAVTAVVNFGDGLTATPSSIVDSVLSLNIPLAARNGPFSVVVDTLPSNNFDYAITPVITDVTSAPITGGKITISGYYLNNMRQNNTATSWSASLLPSTSCNGLFKEADDTLSHLSCTLPSGSGTHTLSLTIDGKTVTKSFVYGLPVISTAEVDANNKINITGDNLFAQGVNTTVLFGSSLIASPSFSGASIIFDAPAGALNDYVTIFIDGAPVKTASPVNLYPILASASPSTTAGSAIVLSGSFLNSYDAANAQTTLTVVINGQPCQVTADTETTSKQVVAPAGVGSALTVTITVNGLSSSINTFAYLPPTISNIFQSGNSISVVGTNFGSSKDTLNAPTGMTTTDVGEIYATFTLPTFYRSGDITITVGGQTASHSFIITPIITSFVATYADGGDVVITGSYLNGQWEKRYLHRRLC
ncbi:hypothetical protein SAMD00019534_072560 [Acytostelium subglobosum LB1]|uniref:hypothetical protein n=1 Tax=Acytostelium subglobosum LB1 TaxID=1410327 RepID=UPI0006447DC8|nr:hypothetical protein SAMD00019534_072560 [Acytostelium subglobosum LB1]GAM24081.1 hypothetical protein SAMD00019534_072560 [Acytostelium subglobosum LB1]|eukprot:XP_012753117.1 hypothetical protein SAMD00019534_072560 [Acytostelium subglobosum LB1]